MDSTPYDQHDEWLPWDRPSASQPQRSDTGHSMSDLRPWDPTSVVQVPLQYETRMPVFKAGPGTAMTGDMRDLQQNLYACCQIGHLQRAAEIVRRLSQTYLDNAPELSDAHQHYLHGCLRSLQLEPNKEKYLAMQRWLELEVKAKGIKPTPAMLAAMIKGAFCILDGSRLDRTVRRYLAYAHGISSDMLDATADFHFFTNSERARIVRLAPAQYENPHELVELDEGTETLTQAPNLTNDEQPEPQATSAEGESRTTALPTLFELPELELRAVEQKGHGLTILKAALDAAKIDGEEGGTREPTQKQLEAQQVRLEMKVLEVAIQRWRAEAESNQAMRTLGLLKNPSIGSIMHDWIVEMCTLVREEIKIVENADTQALGSQDTDRMLIGPFLTFVAPDKMCAAAILAYLGMLNDQRTVNPTAIELTRLVMRVGTTVGHEIQTSLAKLKLKTMPAEEQRRQLVRLDKATPQKKQTIARRILDSSIVLDPHDPERLVPGVPDLTQSIRAKLGAFFISLLIKVAKMPVSVTISGTNEVVTRTLPVVGNSKIWRNGKRVGVVLTHVELINKMKREPVGSMIAKYLPMVVPPRKWETVSKGPYYRTVVPAVRFKDVSRAQKAYIDLAVNKGDMKQVFAGLDVISKVPWRINKRVFRVLADCWNTGEPIAGLPPENPMPDYPQEPDKSETYNHRRWKNVMREIHNEIVGWHSQRCYINFQLECAKAYLDRVFYCPHNVDFRGRAYPIPPYLNHMSADNIRGCFMFAEGKELGEAGLHWLKVHLANVFGYDKESISARAAFTEEHLADIYDSATNPMTGRRWWMKSEDPFQTLAACMELTEALDSPVPTKYVSHLPVQQDGSCNGLQHYAALGGDTVGARQVNLMPGDKPSDIYSAVADMVREEVTKAAAEGYEMAIMLKDHIARKVVKQPVMTNVYGVTFHGARAQVKKQLLELLPKASLDNDINPNTMAGYIAKEIFVALGKMFNGAQLIQAWLGECGARISQAITPEQLTRIKQKRAGQLSEVAKFRRKMLKGEMREAMKGDYMFKSTIVWTTPLGLPVVQPYRVSKFRTIKTNMQELQLVETTSADPVSLKKQLQAFPPNFIHSLDATHMMLSALKCDEIGLTFAAVHDSFWTHAADIPTMNRVLRDAFVRMHSEDIIGRLREELVARYDGCLYMASVRWDSVVADKISAWREQRGRRRNQFVHVQPDSEAQIDELLAEYERQQLLQSDDPAKRAEGRAMVTPASILEAEADVEKDVVSEGQAVQILGTIDANLEADAADDGIANEAARRADALTNAGDDHIDSLDEGQDIVATKPDEDVDADEVGGAEPVQSAETTAKKPKKPRKAGTLAQKLYLWMPLTFPPAPPKGEFDVSKLKESQYFFS